MKMSFAEGSNEIPLTVEDGFDDKVNNLSKCQYSIEASRSKRLGDLMSPLIIILITWISFFLLHDQIYPGQVTGQDADGNAVTLSVCSPPSQCEELYNDRVDTVRMLVS